MEDPVVPISVHESGNYLVALLLTHGVLDLLEVFVGRQLSAHLGLVAIDALTALDFELLLFEELSFALFHFKIEETVGLSRPSDGANVDLRHLDFRVHGR